MIKNVNLKSGTIVQLNPELCKNKMLSGCFMVLTEIEHWGVQGYIQCPGENFKSGGQAYYRADWEEIEVCGNAFWIVDDD